jgi:prepilin signal peptidase PulO-like enzyme (type II secretory pathway)
VGSLLNVLIYRLPRDEQWISGRSYCPFCKAKLSAKDLIPILSWLLLKSKCRHCRKPISWQYPAVELANGLLWAGIGWLSGNGGYQLSGMGHLGLQNWSLVTTILVLALISCLLILFVIDLKHYIIPDQLVIVIVSIGIILAILADPVSRLLWATGAFAFLYLLHLITRGKGMGFGDVKLAFGMGMILKSSVIVALMSSFFIGALVGTGLLFAKLKKLKQPIPFGPFLVIGIIIGLLYGDKILVWYLTGLGY